MPFILVTIKLQDFAFCLFRVTMVLSMLRCHGNSNHLEMAIIYVVLLSHCIINCIIQVCRDRSKFNKMRNFV